MGREREDFVDAVNEAGRQSNTADLAADLAANSHQMGQLAAELHEERLWRKRYGRLFMLVMVFMVGVLVYLTSIAQTNRTNGGQVRCTQDFIVDLVNPASPLRDKLRANEPITNPCR